MITVVRLQGKVPFTALHMLPAVFLLLLLMFLAFGNDIGRLIH